MRHLFKSSAAACVLSAASTAWAGGFADQVVRYSAGTAVEGDPEAGLCTNPNAALNKPASNNNQPYSYVYEGVTYEGTDTSVITPFNAQATFTELAGIGAGGELVLHLASPASTDGKTIAVHTGVGLSVAWPAAQNLPVAMPYTDSRIAIVSVAQTLENWVVLGEIDFNLPTNYYSQGVSNPVGGTDPGTEEADFFQPFLGQLSDFDGKDWDQTLAVLDGSAGGTWLDLSDTGLSEVNYIRFEVPSGAIANMYVDGVVSVPEPGAAAALALAGLIALRRRR